MKTKKRCCKDKPRCKKCPVVWKRLEATGHAERVDKRNYRVISVVPKAAMAAARTR